MQKTVCGLQESKYIEKHYDLFGNLAIQTITNPSMRLVSMWITQLERLLDWAVFYNFAIVRGQ